MSKINHKLIDNTKIALREALEHLTKLSDGYVDSLVEKIPSRFSDDYSTNPDAVVNPYPLIQDMANSMDKRLSQFITDFHAGKKDEAALSVVKKPRWDS